MPDVTLFDLADLFEPDTREPAAAGGPGSASTEREDQARGGGA